MANDVEGNASAPRSRLSEALWMIVPTLLLAAALALLFQMTR